jgi:hypothetical protein
MVIPSGAPRSTLVQDTWTWVISHRDLPLDLLFALFHLQRVPHVVERLPVGCRKGPNDFSLNPREKRTSNLRLPTPIRQSSLGMQCVQTRR